MSAAEICIHDSFARCCSSEVIAVSPARDEGGGSSSRSRSKDGNEQASRSPPLWAVQLSQTVLYAEGGGQPGDMGTLTLACGAALRVIDVQRTSSGGVLHIVASEGSLPVGSSVQIDLDWDRRLDHMQHHTVRPFQRQVLMHAPHAGMHGACLH